MTTYYTKVSDELMPEVRSGEHLPSCLRLVREIGPADLGGWTMVEFEDDDAPEWMDGEQVTPVISRSFAESEPTRTWISDRIVE